MENNRFIFWDIIKGLAIIAVVYGHAGAPNINIVYMYHLTLFFFVSGYLYKDKYTNEPYIYIAQKIKTLLVPAIKYYLIFTLLHNLFLKFNVYSSLKKQQMITTVFPYDFRNMITAIWHSIFMNTWETIAGPIWFIKPLFVAMILFCIIRHFSKSIFKNQYSELIVTLFILILGVSGYYFASNKVVLEWKSETALLVLPIIYCGYITSKKFKVEKLKWYYALICAITIFILSYKNIQIDLATNTLPPLLYFYLASFSGIYLNLFLAKLIMKTKFLATIFSYIGEMSFDIMALHLLSFKLVNFLYVKQNKLPKYLIARYPILDTKLWLMYFIIGILGPIVLLYIIKILKNRLLKLEIIKRIIVNREGAYENK